MHKHINNQITQRKQNVLFVGKPELIVNVLFNQNERCRGLVRDLSPDKLWTKQQRIQCGICFLFDEHSLPQLIKNMLSTHKAEMSSRFFNS